MRKYGSAMVILALLVSAHGQAANQDVIKITAELVQVDVAVVDKNNKPVAGLAREDFEVFDNGKRQHIRTFAYEESKARRLGADPEAARTLPKAITAGELKRAIAFVVDTMHMNTDLIRRTQRMLEEFIEKKMEPGDLVLIMPTAGGSGLLQQFTTDQRLLRRAVNRLRPFIISVGSATPRRELYTAMDRRAGLQPRGINPIDPLEHLDVLNTLSSMNNVINSLGRLPGRKLGVFISPGFRVNKTQTNLDLRDTTTRANRANVIFYSIDPRGLDSRTMGAGDDIFAESAQDVQRAVEERFEDAVDEDNSINAIALNTGGKVYRNNNDIRRGLDDMLEVNSAYYLLGFQPEEGKWDGRYHQLKVVVRGRPDLTVITRRGYLAREEKKAEKESPITELSEAINSPLVRRDLDLQVTPVYRAAENGDPVAFMLLHIDAAPLTFKEEEGKHRAKVEVSGYVLNARGDVAERFRDLVDMNLPPKTYEEVRKRGVVANRTLGIKPGVYQVRVVVREPETGMIGTANDFFEVPDLKSDRLALSSLFTDARLVQGQRAAADSGNTMAQRRFPRNSQFAYAFFIYNARAERGQPQLETAMRVRRGWRVVYAGQPAAVQILPGSTLPAKVVTGGILQLKNLDPGDYTLEILVTDRLEKRENRRTARQEIDFTVE